MLKEKKADWLANSWITLYSFILWFLAILVTILMFTLLLLPALFIFRSWRLSHRVATIWGRSLLFISRIKVKVVGKENFYQGGSMVIISNHQSMADILLFFAAIDIPFAWLAKESLFHVPIIGVSMKAARYIPVERSNRKDALKSLYRAADTIVRRNCSVIIFPEGTRSLSNDQMRPFKKGSFILAKRVKRPIQPITVQGTGNIIPSKQKKHRMQRIYPGQVTMFIHPPLLPEQYADMSIEELSEQLWNVIAAPLSHAEGVGKAGRAVK